MTPTPQPSEADRQAASPFRFMLHASEMELLAQAFAAVRAEAAAAEREACAKLCDHDPDRNLETCGVCALAIRARGEANRSGGAGPSEGAP